VSQPGKLQMFPDLAHSFFLSRTFIAYAPSVDIGNLKFGRAA